MRGKGGEEAKSMRGITTLRNGFRMRSHEIVRIMNSIHFLLDTYL